MDSGPFHPIQDPSFRKIMKIPSDSHIQVGGRSAPPPHLIRVNCISKDDLEVMKQGWDVFTFYKCYVLIPLIGKLNDMFSDAGAVEEEESKITAKVLQVSI